MRAFRRWQPRLLIITETDFWPGLCALARRRGIPLALVNGRISLNDIDLGGCCGKGVMRVSLWGKNLADEEYRNFGIDFDSIGFAGNRFGWPRTYGLDVEYAL